MYRHSRSVPRIPQLLLFLAGGAASAQSISTVVSNGDSFLGFTVGEFRDIAIRDSGDFLAVTLTPQSTSPLVIQRIQGVDSVFTPGLVPGLTGAKATLLFDTFPRFPLPDYFQAGNTITLSNAPHGLLVGEAVRLHFISSLPGTPPPADGFFTVQNVLDPFTFTIQHPNIGNCGSMLAPCGKAEIVHTVQSADLNSSVVCTSAYQGVMQLEDDDNAATAPLITPTQNDSGIFWNSNLLLREGATSNAPQVGPGTTYKRIWRTVVDSQQDYLLLARMDDPAISGTEDALVKIDVSGTCPPTVVGEQVLVRTGTTIQNSGNRKFSTFDSIEQGSFDFNERGDFIYLGKLVESDGFPSVNQPVIVNNRAVLTEFNRVGGGTGVVMQLPLAAVDLNDLGDYVVQAKVQLPTKVGTVIGKGHASGGGTSKFIEVGNQLPDTSLGLPNEVMLAIGNKAAVINPLQYFPVLITNGGDIVWYGEWGHVDVSGSEVTVGRGIFFNNKVIAQVGQVFGPDDILLDVGTSTSVDTAELRAELTVSPNGRYVFFEGLRGKLSDPTFANTSLFRIDLGESITYGTVATGCTFAYPPASLDCTPGLFLPGSTTLADFPLVGHNLQLIATSAPVNTVSVLFAFKPTAPANFPCGSFQPSFPFEILLGTGPSTNFNVPLVGSSAVVTLPISSSSLGQIWFCQAYFKDSGGTTIGATNGIRLTFGVQ